MDFDAALRYMDGLTRFGWKLGLERFEALCERLGNPQRHLRVIHVAGTKGKGSTTALAAAILQRAGYSTGAYFSPYVYDVRERVQLNGQMIPREDFGRLVGVVRPHMEALAQTDHGQATEFELKTAVAFLYFAERRVGFACLEVGLGGRLDATNVVKPLVTVITNIGLDHTEILGDTHAKIAAEKAGILKPGAQCFTATENAEALEVIERVASERAVPLTRVVAGLAGTPTGADLVLYAPDDARSSGSRTFCVATRSRAYPDLQLRMRGSYQRANAACAVAAVETALQAVDAELPGTAVREALAFTQLPGRFQTLRARNGALIVLDGAHNAMAAEALASEVARTVAQEGVRRTLLVAGMVAGHAPDGVLAALASLADRVYACRPDWRRSLPATEIAATAARYCRCVEVVPRVVEAARAAIRAAGPRDLVLISGSLYTVGEARPSVILETEPTPALR